MPTVIGGSGAVKLLDENGNPIKTLSEYKQRIEDSKRELEELNLCISNAKDIVSETTKAIKTLRDSMSSISTEELIYDSNKDLPLNIRKIYTPKQQTVFRKTWNAVYKQYGDEGKAFAIAHTQAKATVENSEEVYNYDKVDSEIENLLKKDIAEFENLSFNSKKFIPSYAGEVLTDLNVVLEKLSSKEEDIVFFERVLNGQRIIFTKIGKDIEIREPSMSESVDDSKLDLEQSILSSLTSLTSDNIIVEGLLSNNIIYLNDLLYLGKDLTKEKFIDRRRLLSSLAFDNNVKESPIIIVKPSQYQEAIKMYSKLYNSSGCSIRNVNSVYTFGKDSSWNIYLSDGSSGSPYSGHVLEPASIVKKKDEKKVVKNE